MNRPDDFEERGVGVGPCRLKPAAQGRGRWVGRLCGISRTGGQRGGREPRGVWWGREVAAPCLPAMAGNDRWVVGLRRVRVWRGRDVVGAVVEDDPAG